MLGFGLWSLGFKVWVFVILGFELQRFGFRVSGKSRKGPRALFIKRYHRSHIGIGYTLAQQSRTFNNCLQFFAKENNLSRLHVLFGKGLGSRCCSLSP